MLHDFLDCPLLTWRDSSRRRHTASLPGVISHLASGELSDFPRLRTHQLHPWCMFLTQLAAIALHRANETDPRRGGASWRDLLLSLTGGRHEPWCLVVEDLEQPAFFQPPIPEGALDGRWKAQSSPDDIDVLATAKSHDVKACIVPCDDVEAWLYAILTLQTTQGFFGAGKYGVARMNGGFGSRCRVGYAPDATLSARFCRDVAVLLGAWPESIARGYSDAGVALTWTEPWDGTTTLPIGDLAPHFIEVCRRSRLSVNGGRLLFHGTTSSVRRCAPEVGGGDVGDVWIPIRRAEGTALSVGERGFHYRLLVDLLFENEFAAPAAMRAMDDDPESVVLVASALARGDGGTAGLHERTLTLARPFVWRIRKQETRATLGKRAGERVAVAGRMHDKVLYPALKTLGVVGRDEFHARVDDAFFDHLFATLDDSDEDARLAWDRRLRELAEGELQRAMSRCALPSARRFKLTSAAEGMFLGCLRKNFPDISQVDSPDEGASR